MVKIRDLAKELGVGSSEIIYFLKNSAFAFPYKLCEYYEIDSFWESKVRNYFHGKNSSRMFIGDLALELNVEPENITRFLMRYYGQNFSKESDTNYLGEYWVDTVKKYKNYVVNPEKPIEQQKKSQISSSTHVYKNAFDVPQTSSSAKVYKSVFDVPNSKTAEQAKEESANNYKPSEGKCMIEKSFYEFTNKYDLVKKSQNKQKCNGDVKNILVDMLEDVGKYRISDRNGSEFWEKITTVIKDAKQHIDGDKVKIAFAGNMKAGKSTLVNMILGEDLSATGITRATATIIEFHYSLDERVEFIKNGRVCSKIENFDERGKAEAQKKMRLDTNEFDFIRIYCKKEILNTFVLVDVPGAGDLEGSVRQKIKEYLTKNEVATIVWVSDISTSLPKDECDYINELRALDKNMIFVLNCKEEKTPEQILEFDKNFKRNFPEYKPHIFSVKVPDKPQISAAAPERIREQSESVYKKVLEDQKNFKTYLEKSSKKIRENNETAVLKNIPNEFEAVLKKEREAAIKERAELRRKFFDEFAIDISNVLKDVKCLSDDLETLWTRTRKNIDTAINNRNMSSIGEWGADFQQKIFEQIDAIFNKFVAKVQKHYDQYKFFVDIDFVQKVILFKEAMMQSIVKEITLSVYAIQNRGIGDIKIKNAVKAALSKIVGSIEFFFTLIFDDCLANFVAHHNEIWLNYLDKKINLANSINRTGFNFNAGKNSLLVLSEEFHTTPAYDAWVDETLSIYAKELASDNVLTSSEERLFMKFYSALYGKKKRGEYFRTAIEGHKNCPILYRFKAETTEGKELREFMNGDYSWSKDFDQRTKILDEIKRGVLKDFDKLLSEFADICKISEVKNRRNIEWDLMPENYKN